MGQGDLRTIGFSLRGFCLSQKYNHKKSQDIIMSKDIDSTLVVSRNEDVVSASFLFFMEKLKKPIKKDIVTNIEFEAILFSIKSTSLISVCLILLIY